MPFAALQDIALHYVQEGQGSGLPLYVLPGGPALDHTYLLDDLRPLGEGRPLYFVDPRGCGRSGRGRLETYRLEQLADDMEALRQALGHAAVDVLGHSMGGMIAQLWAIRHPASIRRLVLVGSSPRPARLSRLFATPGRLGAKLRLLGLAAGSAIGWLTGKQTQGALLRSYWQVAWPLYAARRRPDPPIGRLYAAAVKDPVDFLVPLQRVMYQADWSSELPRIRCPTLILCGEEDGLAFPDQQKLASGISTSRLAIIPGAGHSPFRDDPQLFQTTVTRFLAEDA